MFRGPPGAADTGTRPPGLSRLQAGAPHPGPARISSRRVGCAPPQRLEEGGRGVWALAPGWEGRTCAHPQSECPLSARTPVPLHASRRRPRCNRLSPPTRRACGEGLPAPGRLAARHAQPGVGERAPHVPESPGQRSPSSRAASPRPETAAEGLSVHFRSPLHPLIRPVCGACA